jgi:NAD(P)-dependent dehydrogenase (short-subunit alcohol dehydrogenase family)
LARRIALPATESESKPTLHGPVLVIQDEGGLWESFKADFQKKGIKIQCLALKEGLQPSLENLEALLSSFSNPFQGILDLRMATSGKSLFKLNQEQRHESIDSQLLWSFILAKYFLNHQEAQTDSKLSDPFFFSITSRGGRFGTDAIHPLCEVQGGVVGLLKCLAKEAPELKTCVIDISPQESSSQIIKQVMDELVSKQGPVEIGYRNQCRYALSTVPVPLAEQNLSYLDLTEDDLVLVTGGARGITAEMVRSLAGVSKASFILLGRSSQSIPEMEGLETGLEDKVLKAKLFKRMQDRNEPVSPRKIETLFKKIRSAEEIQGVMDWMEVRGHKARYHSLDITNAEEVHRFFEDPETNPGSVSVLIHGAGILDDQWISQKTESRFSRVIDTKVKGLFSLLDALQGHPLKRVCLFSSVAGKFGNPGQSDYAAANEILNHLALNHGASPFPDCRWLSINWGPFRGGMVTDQLEKKFEAEGVELIPPEIGAKHFLRELQLPAPSEPEILIGGAMSQELSASLPGERFEEPALHWEETICEKSHPYLGDHVIKEPVLPMAMVIELCAKSALKNFPSLKFFSIRDLEVLQGLTFPGIERQLTIRCIHEITPRSEVTVKVEILSKKEGRSSELRLCYQALVDLVQNQPSQTQAEIPKKLASELKVQSFSGGIDRAYEEFLFHGKRLRAITKIHGHSQTGIMGALNSSQPIHLLDSPSESIWITDPLILDGMAQLGLVWLGTHQGCIGIPQGMQSYTQLHPFSEKTVQCLVKVANLNPKTYKIGLDFWFLDSESKLLGFGKGWNAVFNESFNSYTTQAKRRIA